jgi:hypothetical protein
VPHVAQNRAPAGLVVDPHDGQPASNRVPHSTQKRAPAGLGVPHAGQVT